MGFPWEAREDCSTSAARARFPMSFGAETVRGGIAECTLRAGVGVAIALDPRPLVPRPLSADM